MFSEPFTRDLVDVAKTTDKPIFVIWGAPPGTDDTYYKRLLDGGLPVFRTFGNCVGRDARRTSTTGTFAGRYRSPFADAPTEPLPAAKRARKILDERRAGRGALGARVEAAAEGLRHQAEPRRAVHDGARGGRRRPRRSATRS